MRKIDLVLTEVRETRTEMLTEIRELRTETRSELRAMSGRIDALNGRVDTVIDALADLRRDFDTHTHE